MLLARDIRARLRLRQGWSRSPLLVAGALLAAGVLLRLPVFLYHGAPTQHAFNAYIFRYPGSYSDVASLYFRDHLWRHPAPFFDYKFEYPVLTGAFVWVVGFIHGSVTSYTLASGAVLAALGLATVALVRRFEGSRVWILALAPALGLDVVLNWDFLAITFTVAALLLYRRGRDGWAGGVLALAVWAKFFPLLLLPLVVLTRLRQRAWRSLAGGLLWFGVVSVAVNLPVALQRAAAGGGFVVRPGWEYFFKFNQQRSDAGNLWWFLGVLHPTADQINTASAVLLVAGLTVIMLAMMRGSRHAPASALVTPALLGAIAWFFFINKVYSPQYGLWVIVLLAILGAPLRLAIPFVVIDALYWAASFVAFRVHTDWYFPVVLRPAAEVRELVLLALVGWSVHRLAGPGSALQLETPAPNPAGAPVSRRG